MNVYFKPKWIHKAKSKDIKLVLLQRDNFQKQDIDYKEIFSLISSKDSFKIIMALVAHFDLELPHGCENYVS